MKVYNGGSSSSSRALRRDHRNRREEHDDDHQMVRAPAAAAAAQDLGFGDQEDDQYERLVEAAVAAAEEEDVEAERRGAGAAAAAAGLVAATGRKNENPELASRAGNAGLGGGGRDDWSEDATRALLAAWGERYLRLSRGSLKLEDWMEVSRIVSACCLVPKTEVQCKNRVDTLKKKFKSERQKLEASGGAAAAARSKWLFYSALDKLLSMGKDDHQQHEGLPGAIDAGEMVRPRRAASCLPSDDEDEYDDQGAASTSSEGSDGDRRKKKKRKLSRKRKVNVLEDEEDDGAAMRELSNAIERFGEIYERIESSKQQQMADLERVRMEFARDLEMHRMQLLMQTQIEVARVKHPEVDDAGLGGVLAGINLENSTNF